MNNRFKFRVWNIKHGFYCDQMTEMVINSNGVCYDNGVRADYFEYNGFVIELCTGLKDKNGNLIYEGDILSLHNNKFEVGHNNITVFFKCLTDEYTHIDPMDFDYDESEIIGNIHENKGESID